MTYIARSSSRHGERNAAPPELVLVFNLMLDTPPGPFYNFIPPMHHPLWEEEITVHFCLFVSFRRCMKHETESSKDTELGDTFHWLLPFLFLPQRLPLTE